MAKVRQGSLQLVNVQVEFFGLARILSGRRQVELSVPEASESGDVVVALAETCPELVGGVLLEDRSGLRESYTFNLNGTSFICDQPMQLRTGDSILLFSSQAGG